MLSIDSYSELHCWAVHVLRIRRNLQLLLNYVQLLVIVLVIVSIIIVVTIVIMIVSIILQLFWIV